MNNNRKSVYCLLGLDLGVYIHLALYKQVNAVI